MESADLIGAYEGLVLVDEILHLFYLFNIIGPSFSHLYFTHNAKFIKIHLKGIQMYTVKYIAI